MTVISSERMRSRGRVTALATSGLLAAAMAAVCAPAPAVAATPTAIAAAAYARMTPAQRIGQLFMVGAPATGSSTSLRDVLARHRVGSVVLMGASYAGTSAVAAVVAPLRRVTTQAGVPPFVATDQEGGYVQRLTGPGFSTIPTAVKQGLLATTTLRSDWRVWATQLRRAGVNLDLAPVADVVPASIGTANQPIGRWYREYGFTTAVVSSHVAAAVLGMRDVGVAPTAKHFPGLGRATGNTDTTLGVTDPTRRYDAYLAPFRGAIAAGVPAVMVSTAIYPNIDVHTVAAFSHLVTTTMLRYELGFTGLIVSDSLQARSVSGYSYASRAILALDAGIDLLLLPDSTPVAAMTSAIATRAATRPAFAAVVKTAVLRVLTAKAKQGLITG